MNNVLEMLEKSAQLYPDKVAFKDPDDSISFVDLLSQSKRCAFYFLSNSIIDPGSDDASVLFFMDKCVKCMPIMFGAVYSNAFYTFADVRQSRDRVRHIIDTVEPNLIITDEEHIEQLKGFYSEEEYAELTPRVMLVGDLRAAIGNIGDAAASLSRDMLDAAREQFYSNKILYVNFTSGSTGVPKGVAVGHASVIDFIEVFTKTFDITSDEVIANQAPFDFDVSVKDIYSGLYTGATVVIIPRSYFTKPFSAAPLTISFAITE